MSDNDPVSMVVIFKHGNHISVGLPRKTAQESIKAWMDYRIQNLPPFFRNGTDPNGMPNFAYDISEVIACYYHETPDTRQKLVELQEEMVSIVKKQVGDGDEWKSE